jgi:hypothetical protein
MHLETAPVGTAASGCPAGPSPAVVFPLELPSARSSQGMDRRDPMADCHRHRVDGLALVPQHQPHPLSVAAFSFRSRSAPLRNLAFLYSQRRSRRRLRHTQFSLVSRLASHITRVGKCEVEAALGSDRSRGNRIRGESRRMAPELYPLAHGKMAGCCAGYLRGNRSPDSDLSLG